MKINRVEVDENDTITTLTGEKMQTYNDPQGRFTLHAGNNIEVLKTYHKQANYRYNQHKGTAIKRGIEWLFTFDTWLATWKASGHYDEMGNRKGQYCMARTNDEGPYSPDNVRVTTTEDNHREAVLSTRKHTSIENQPNKYSFRKGHKPWNAGKEYNATPSMKKHLDRIHQAACKAVITPQGKYDSIKDAAIAHNLHHETARRWAKTNRNGWSLST